MADLNDLTSEMANRARDAAYVAVGLGVLGLQRAQVQRRQLEAKLGAEADLGERFSELVSLVTASVQQLDDLAGRAVDAVEAGVQQLDDLAGRAVDAVEAGLQPLEDQLPAAARGVAQRMVEQAREVGTQLKQLVDRSDHDA